MFPDIFDCSHPPLNRYVIPLRFCKKCIEEKISETGTSYFATEWLHGTYCEKHETMLWRVKKSREAKANMQNILRYIMAAHWETAENFIEVTKEAYKIPFKNQKMMKPQPFKPTPEDIYIDKKIYGTLL
ncbi:hypothetical protein ACJJIU_13655 [Microbulbifer sp. CnH-101-E]|uniref:hypothetical protein n=1 Tax=unclassified Microbulbifer TaxID=2619833 RepID=UPI0040395F37